METAKVDLRTLASVVGVVLAIEAAGILVSKTMAPPRLLLLGGMRVSEILAVSLIFIRRSGDLPTAGSVAAFFRKGIAGGLRWSLWVAVCTATAFLVCYGVGMDPLSIVGGHQGGARMMTAGYFVVGAVLSPVAEELVFRKTIYAYFRRWGLFLAIFVSTVCFVLAHKPIGFVPVPQIIGGMIFAVSYEVEKNLIVPVMIHMIGNFALFSLSFL